MSRAPQYGRARVPAGETASQPSTPHQRLYARTLMEERGLPTIAIVDRHQRFFRAAGLEPRGIGRRVDAVLEELTRAEIVRLTDALRRNAETPAVPFSSVPQHIQIGQLLVELGEKPAFVRNAVSHGIESMFRSVGLTPSSKLLSAAVRSLTEWQAERLIDHMKQRLAQAQLGGTAA